MKRFVAVFAALALAVGMISAPAMAANKNLWQGWTSNNVGNNDFYDGQSFIVYAPGDAKLSPALTQASNSHWIIGATAGSSIVIDAAYVATTGKDDITITALNSLTYGGSSFPQTISIGSTCSYTPSVTHPCFYSLDLTGVTLDEAHDYYLGIAFADQAHGGDHTLRMARCFNFGTSVSCASPLSGWFVTGETTVLGWAVNGTIVRNASQSQMVMLVAVNAQ